MDSWVNVSGKVVTAEQEERYFDHGQQDADRAENRLCRSDARDLLRKIQDLDGYIQR